MRTEQNLVNDHLKQNMNGLVCPHCHERSDRSEMWVRIENDTDVDPRTTAVQSLLTKEAGPENEELDEDMECMTTLHPCGHSFPRDALKTVEEQVQILNELLEEHADTTNAFEMQLLRGEIHSMREQLDVTTEHCKTKMDATR
jgi:hypothetical protein